MYVAIYQASPSSEAEALRGEVDRYRRQARAAWRQVADLKRFLNDYGMVWVGDGENENTAGASGTAPPNPVPSRSSSRSAVEEPQASTAAASADATPRGGIPHASSAPSTRPTWTGLDMKLLQRRINDLNTSLEGPSARAQAVPVVVYKDGLQLHTWPFRPVTDAGAQGILMDIMDGYFPFILQDEFPDGVPLILLDMAHLEYLKGVPPLPSSRNRATNQAAAQQQPGNIVSFSEMSAKQEGAAVSKETFLKQLPHTVIKDGRVIEVRNEIKALLDKGGNKPAAAAGPGPGGLTPSQAAAEAASQRSGLAAQAGRPVAMPAPLDRRAASFQDGRPPSAGAAGPSGPESVPSSSAPRPRISSGGSSKMLAPLKPRAPGAEVHAMMDMPAIDQLLAGRRTSGAKPRGEAASKLDWMMMESGTVAAAPALRSSQELAKPASSARSETCPSPASEEESESAPGAMLQVKSFDGQQTFVIKLRATDTIGALRRRVQGLVLIQEFEIRTAFPPVVYADDAQTLQEAGLVPSATLILRK